MIGKFFSQIVLSLFVLSCFDVSALAPESFSFGFRWGCGFFFEWVGRSFC